MIQYARDATRLALVAAVGAACLALTVLGSRREGTVLLVEPGHTRRLLAETPEGVRVYRIDGPGVVVPLVLCVSPGGHTSVR
jgi:hypothetical protein